MQYFVSIENCQYFHWQIAILFESLSSLGLKNNLVIGCAELEKTEIPLKSVVYHENIGRTSDYLALNKPFAILKALEKGILQFPFAVIDPDMIVWKPLPIKDNLSAQYVDYMNYDVLAHYDGYNMDEFGVSKQSWKPVGCVYQFPRPSKIIEEIYSECKLLMKNFPPESGKLKTKTSYWQREMLAFALPLNKHHVAIEKDWQRPLDLRKTQFMSANIIHYCNGFLPYFDKRTNNNLRYFSFGEPLPFNSIMSIPSGKDVGLKKFKEITHRAARNEISRRLLK